MFFPGESNERSTIFDFKGHVGVAEITGAGTSVDTHTGKKHRLFFDRK